MSTFFTWLANHLAAFMLGSAVTSVIVTLALAACMLSGKRNEEERKAGGE